MSSSAATLAGNVGAAARAHKERVLVSHTRSAFRSGPLSGWGARRERAYRELRAVLRGGGGGRAFIQGVEEERSESVEYRSLESVISCGVQSVCVGSGACVRSVKRSVHHILHREWPRENVYVTACIVTIQNSNRQRRASLLHMVSSSCTPETGGLASHWTLPESETKFAFGFGPPDAHIPADAQLRTVRRLRSGNRILAVRDCETPSRSRQSPEHSAQRVDSVCNTSTKSSTCPELPASST
jgi:hypothetical protein